MIAQFIQTNAYISQIKNKNLKVTFTKFIGVYRCNKKFTHRCLL